MTKNQTDLQNEINELSKTEFLIETNDGTFGSAEACRKIGTGDPAFANRKVYETVSGARRATGPDEADAPGRMRHINEESMKDARETLEKMREELRAENRKTH